MSSVLYEQTTIGGHEWVEPEIEDLVQPWTGECQYGEHGECSGELYFAGVWLECGCECHPDDRGDE